VLRLVVISSCMKLTLVSGSESSLLSTRPVTNDADILQFNDVFRISIDEDRLYSCSVQLHVISVVEDREQCWVWPNVWLVFLVSVAKLEARFWGFHPACFLTADILQTRFFDAHTICIQSWVRTGAKVLNQKLQKRLSELAKFWYLCCLQPWGIRQQHLTVQHVELIPNTAHDLRWILWYYRKPHGYHQSIKVHKI